MILGILCLAFILYISLTYQHETVRVECKTHKWEYNAEDRLQCTNCMKYPGDDKDE